MTSAGKRVRRHHHRDRSRRRHAGPAPRPVGQADPAAGARRLAAPRAAELGHRGGVRQQPLHLAGHVVRRGRQGLPAADPLLRGRRDQALRRGALPDARGGLRRAAPPRRRLARPGRSRTTDMEPYYTQAEQLYQVHGARGEDPTEPPASAPYPYPPVSHEPRIQQLSDDLAAAGLPPVPRAVRHHAQRGEHALQRLRALPDLRRVPVPGARQVRRRGARASGRRSSIPTSPC